MQFSPIQCTYSNIFTRFFKYFPANTIIYQNSYRLIRRAVRLTSGCAVIACTVHYGDPAGYCVPVGKRNKQAKDKQLSFTAIVWSKVKFMTRNALLSLRGIANGDAVAISRKGNHIKNPRKILLYLRGEKGAHKQKSEHYRPR